MTGGSNLVIPIVMWGQKAPTHCISAIWMTPEGKNIITGCNDGQIGIWDVTDNFEIYPRSMLFGHTAAISCLAPGSSRPDQPYIVSASENGEMCLWDISDGRCIETTKMAITHTSMQAYHFRTAKDIRLVCSGYYPEITIIDPHTFEIIQTLSSRVAPDWISACCVIRPVKREDETIIMDAMRLVGSSDSNTSIRTDFDDVVLAISNSGAVKVWSLSGSEPRNRPIHEDESKQIRCLNAQTLTCCPYNQRTVLIVCSKYWQIYDAGDFTLLCSESNRCGERWSGGDFVSVDRVIVWSNEGKGYLYKLPTNASADHADYHRQSYQPSSPHAYYILDFYSDSSLACSPAMILHTTKGENSAKQLVRGDSEGQVIIWTLPDVSERQMTLVRQESFDRLPALPPRCSTTLQDVWDNLVQSPAGIIDGFLSGETAALNITATIFIPSQGKLACGRENGTIIIVSAMKSIILQLLEDKFLSHDKIPLKVLQGHDGRITSLLYPFNESTRYEVNHLLSGSADFSVILWDIVLGVKLHTFTVHGGEITQLLVPPDKCNPRILSSVCSVAADHTVTLLSLKERKCILMAARHLFPVQCIRWRPLDDFMVVSCSDGTVYVWQMETGHLDRVVHGMTGEEILNNCDENAMPVDQLINPNITLVQALKRRNLATFKNLAQQKLQSLGQQQQTQDAKLDFSRPQDYPMHIQGIRTNSRDPDSHVIFFDTESLIVQLLTDEFSTMSPGELEAKGMFSMNTKRSSQSDISEAQTKIAEIISKGKDKADTIGQKIQQTVETAGFTSIQTQSVTEDSSRIAEIQQLSPLSIRKKNKEQFHLKTMTMEIAQLFMSFLHAWGLDPDLDKLCLNKLGLLKPKCPISYGLLSREGHMSLMLPGWHKRVCQEEINNAVKERILAQKKTLIQQARSASQVEVGKSVKLTRPTLASLARNDGSDQSCDSDSGPSKPPKQDDTVLQEETKLFSTKARWQISSAVTTQHLLSVISVANTLMSMNHATFRTYAPIRKTSSKRAHGNQGPVMAEVEASFEHGSEDETGDLVMLQQSQIKQGWSLLAALHCVLLPELVGSGEFDPPSLEMLARRWQERCLEIREAAQALLLAELRRLGPEGRKSIVDNWSPYLPTYVDPNVSLLSLEKADEEEVEEEIEQVLTAESPVHKPSKSFENRCKQATAIVMLAVIGAEFGHEIEPSKRKEESKKSKKSSQEGFTLSNYSLARHTSKALTFLLHQPPSKKLPAHTPIRRAAIDLIGRGFTVWEPYLDVSAVLLGLLEICIDADKLVPCMTFGLPLSPAADACRTARHSLSLIATARPAAFIITMAKEVARYNAMAQSSQSQHSQPNNTVLMRAKTEILRMVELLVEKMPSDVADHLVEVMDVTLHCLDVSQLKAKGLTEIFPAICRFSMVCCCNVTKRIWVGAKNGAMAFYEMKQHSKCQMIHAHSGPVIALSVSPDGKYLVSYSHADGKLKVWQTASSSIFGIGSQQTKCTKQMATPPLQVLPHTNLLKLVRLVWIDNRSVVMLTVNGDEIKYSI